MTRYLVPALFAIATISCGGDATGPSNNSPSANFTYSPAAPTTGQSVSFNGAASIDVDGTIAGYSWDFGDGGTGSGTSASHTYATGGTYTVMLTVTDDDGATGNATQEIVVVPSMSGTWQGTFDLDGSQVTTNMILTESGGSVSGSGAFQTSGGSLAFTVTGTHPHPTVALTLMASGFEDTNYSGTFTGNNTVAGALNGSGFNDEPLTINRQ
jgi:PKD repeat protein